MLTAIKTTVLSLATGKKHRRQNITCKLATESGRKARSFAHGSGSSILKQLILLMLLLAPASAWAATFTVDSTTDAVDASPGNGACATVGAVCTLRAAVEETNAFAGADTIDVPANTYNLTLGSGLLVTEQLTINGASQATTIVDGQALNRVFAIAAGITANFSDLTVRNGNIAGDGGGIFN